MKKTIAVLLLIAAVFTWTAAAAQDIEIHREGELFYIVVTLPSGTRVENSQTDEHFSLTEIGYLTSGKPVIAITTAADELYVGLSLSDLPREDIDRIISEISVEMADPKTEVRVTPEGYEYIVVNEQTDANDACDTVMLVNGYFIMVHVYYPDFSTLTPEDEAIGPAIVETFRFVGNTNS
ncbi:MAG TPA: hypothetical protein PKU80_04135 [Candidatus Limiplasma sp.]|nr:hypothetical protein [Candidatus Limiplasma sp.]HRX08695.1 hypothetical protein [Candidatus Limiplasma sp.]